MDRYRDLWRQNDAKTESWKLANQAVQDAVESQQSSATAAIQMAQSKKRRNRKKTPSGQRPTEESDSNMSSATPDSALKSVNNSISGSGGSMTVQQMLSADSPNKKAEEALTTAIADFVHSCGLKFNIPEEPTFQVMIALAKHVPTTYKCPPRKRVGGELLQIMYEDLHARNSEQLKQFAGTYGLTLYGDGATVKKMPLINILAAGYGQPAAVLDIVDCTGHMEEGGKKDAKFIVELFKPHMLSLVLVYSTLRTI
jgi:hypothetical protein